MLRPAPIAALWLAACGAPSVNNDWEEPEHDPGDDDQGEWLFEPDHLVTIDIEMDPDDWDDLRRQDRNLLEMVSGDCLAEPFESPYTYFPATVTVDGTTVEQVGVRKKGLIGSDSSTKPSLKIKFSEYIDEQELDGVERVTLNNGRQDPSLIHQCLGYERFRDAGIAASRCNYATVTLNGEALGVYSNVEPIKKDFLRRHFDDEEGNLYEGTLSDFRDEWIGTFEKKTNKSETDRDDLQAVVDAIDGDDGALEERLDEVIDLDEYYTFWATEVLLGHWDGYAGNTNNFYIYNDPADGRFHFIPWGIDALFETEGAYDDVYPDSVMAAAAIPYYLYQDEVGQAHYVERLTELLDTSWDEEFLLAEVDRMEALIAPEIDDEDWEYWQGGLLDVRTYIEWQRDDILAELEDGPPEWDTDLRGYPCLVEIGTVEGTFSTTWGTIDGDWWTEGEADLQISLWGVDYAVSSDGAAAGDYDDGALILTGGVISPSTALFPYFVVPLEDVQAGAELTVDWWDVEAYLGYTAPGVEWATAAYLYDGTLVLDEAGTSDGDTVSGSFAVSAWGGSG